MRDHELVRRFLLGELRETKTERVEKRLLEDDVFFDLCEAVEAELLEAAARGELAPAERDRVLKRLASSPQGRARLALARGLAELADGKTRTEPLPAPLPFRRRAALTARPAVRWAIAAGLLVLLGGTGTWVLFHPGDGDRIVQQEPAQKTTGGEHLKIIKHKKGGAPASTTPVEDETPPPPPPPRDRDRIVKQTEPEKPAVDVKPVIFELSLLTRRSGEELTQIEKIQIPSGTEHIELHVDVTFADSSSYDVVVMRGDEEIFRESHLEPTSKDDRGPFLVFDLPASDLPAGRYRVDVYGKSADGNQERIKSGEIEVTEGG